MSTVLICDSGSSKSDWWIIANGRSEHLLSTIGYNPYVHQSTRLQEVIHQVKSLLVSATAISELHFYCAGADKEQSPQILEILNANLNSAKCSVKSDLLAVAHALSGDLPCWVAILGTGSNVGFFNGTNIEYQRESMGWYWGDEGSARQITKAVIVSFCRGNFDEGTMKLLQDVLGRSRGDMKQYTLNNPPLEVISECSTKLEHHWSHPIIRELSESTIIVLLKDIVELQKLHQGTVHLSGSVAYFHRDFIKNKLELLGTTCGHIAQFPIQKLIKYHVSKGQ